MITDAEPGPDADQPVVCMPLEPLPVPTRLIIQIGLAIWALALVITLALPALHSGDRSWWPWACAAGLGLGLMGYAYVARGRGDAAAA